VGVDTARAPQGRVIFLDVDGTYADHGVVPEPHAAVVRAARAAGHRVLLCTGRPRAMLPAHILGAGFDGIVASAGGYVELDGQVLADVRFPATLATQVVDVLDRHDAAYLLEAPEALYGRRGVDVRLHALLGPHLGDPDERGPLDILQALIMSDDPAASSFAKITYFDARVPTSVIAAEIGDALTILPSSISAMGDVAGEIQLADVHKAVGIEVVTAHLGLTRDDVVAFGDGLNDLEMLEHAGTAVAIEGADPRLLAVADHVAAGPAAHGLVPAFERLGLVQPGRPPAAGASVRG
jgi:Cof subfamily protein (haloacid dehalogenase superfamily)